MLDSISLKFGSSGKNNPLSYKAEDINIFVGPNNSGKSIALQELQQIICNEQFNTFIEIIQDVDYRGWPPEKIAKAKENYITQLSDATGRQILKWSKGSSSVSHITLEQVDLALSSPQNFKNLFRTLIAGSNVLSIDGIMRLDLVNNQSTTGLGGGELPRGVLDFLFRSDEKRIEVRNILYRAFHKYFVLNPTHLGQLSVSYSDRIPAQKNEELGIDDYSLEFHSKALPLRTFSDGIKAFTGMIATIIAQEEDLVLIDEPEAFLHPKLAFQLGKELGKLSLSKGKQFVIATHSSNFLLGCFQSKAQLNVTRLTYQNNIPTARILDHCTLLQLLRNPLLRSANILNALFYDCVVVTEGDSDRAFYQEINERLLSVEDSRGIHNCLFINAQNKQTIETVLRPLRKLGVPAAAVVDIDILKDNGKTWVHFLRAGNIPEITVDSLAVSRTHVMKQFNSTLPKDMKRDGGILLLSPNEKEACNNILNQLEEYGLFVVRNGELECWLKTLNASGHGTNWLINVFEQMGDNPADSKYLSPESGDVWDFIGNLNTWLHSQNRKGIPD